MDWHDDGLGGLKLTLMRNGYVPCMLPEVTPERLSRAAMLISIAPAREFTAAERQTVRQFVEDGGLLIAMAARTTPGRPTRCCKTSTPRARTFRSRRRRRPSDEETENLPLGCGHWTYLNNSAGFKNDLMCHAGWPIRCPADLSKRSFWVEVDSQRTLAAMMPVGRGKVFVIGDTAFAMNKNLEHATGRRPRTAGRTPISGGGSWAITPPASPPGAPPNAGWPEKPAAKPRIGDHAAPSEPSGDRGKRDFDPFGDYHHGPRHGSGGESGGDLP